jgi:hypothetical protein
MTSSWAPVSCSWSRGHCPVANAETHLVLLEPRGIVNTGDAEVTGTVGERLD